MKQLIGLVNSLLRHSGVDCGLPEVASVGDGRVVDAGGGGGVRRDERLLVHGRGRDDLRRRHLLHRLQRLLPLRLVDVRRRAPVGRNLRRGEEIRQIHATSPQDLSAMRHYHMPKPSKIQEVTVIYKALSLV